MTKASGQSFIQTAETIFELLNPGNWPEQDFGPTIDQATERISHIKLSAQEWQQIACYLALQLRTARSRDGDDERLVIWQVERTIKDFRDRSASRSADQSATAALVDAPSLFGEAS